MPEEWHRMLALQKRKCMIYPLKEKEGMLRLYHRKESIAPILDYGRKAIALKRKQQVWFFTRIMRII